MWKNFQTCMEPLHFNVPPEKIFVELLGLKSLSEKGLKRNSKRITVKKHPYTHLSKYAVLLCRLSNTSRKLQ